MGQCIFGLIIINMDTKHGTVNTDEANTDKEGRNSPTMRGGPGSPLLRKWRARTDTTGQRDLPAVYRTPHPTAGHACFPSAHTTFCRKDHVLGHKRILRKLKTKSCLPQRKPEISSRSKSGKFINMDINTILNSHWIE